MRRRRGRTEDRELCSGPGKLCQALGITRRLDGLDDGRLAPWWWSPPAVALPFEVETTPRIGITKAADWPLRFLVRGNGHVSGRAGRSAIPIEMTAATGG